MRGSRTDKQRVYEQRVAGSIVPELLHADHLMFDPFKEIGSACLLFRRMLRVSEFLRRTLVAVEDVGIALWQLWQLRVCILHVCCK